MLFLQPDQQYQSTEGKQPSVRWNIKQHLPLDEETDSSCRCIVERIYIESVSVPRLLDLETLELVAYTLALHKRTHINMHHFSGHFFRQTSASKVTLDLLLGVTAARIYTHCLCALWSTIWYSKAMVLFDFLKLSDASTRKHKTKTNVEKIIISWFGTAAWW